jgi:threonine/homoserine/homoserine lactone efflux protein
MTATLALNLTPGPDMPYVVARSVGQRQRAGVVSAFGCNDLRSHQPLANRSLQHPL